MAADGAVTRAVPALSVTTDVIRSRNCLARRFSDIAMVDFQIKTAADIGDLTIDLIDPQGMRIIGQPLLVPAVNRGGEIPYGGDITWDARAEVLRDQKLVEWLSREPARFAAPVAGSSYLVVLHLEFTDRRASYEGVRVNYRLEGRGGATTTGPQLTSTAEADVDYRIVPRLSDCGA